MSESHADAKPFFTLTQNALADGLYEQYVRIMYGSKITLTKTNDVEKAFNDYVADVQRRQAENKLKPGESLTMENGKPQVRGQVPVMSINGLIAKMIFDKNPDREFYIEESFPLDWMYPYLEPHGLIMKINRQPLPELSEEIVRKDHEYWSDYVKPMIGDWLNDDTPVRQVAAFAEKAYLKHDWRGFKGDRGFIRDNWTQGAFSKLRDSIGGLYTWRLEHAANDVEKARMAREADFAFRQAFALCPYYPEAVYRYVQFLRSQNRISDALLVAETAAKFPASPSFEPDVFRNLARQLKAMPPTK